MAPLEKANQLVKNFPLEAWGKEHAMSCVDEIILALSKGYMTNDIEVAEFQDEQINYWNQVKVELEKMKFGGI